MVSRSTKQQVSLSVLRAPESPENRVYDGGFYDELVFWQRYRWSICSTYDLIPLCTKISLGNKRLNR